MASANLPARSGRFSWLMAILATAAFVLLLGLGTWQVQRLYWKEGLLADIAQRTTLPPAPLSEIEKRYAETHNVEYWPAEAHGTFRNDAERHFFATYDGQSGFFVYTPLELTDGRFLLVNRGFVPYDQKDPAKRPGSQPAGEVVVTGLARDPLAGKPSWSVPENEPAKNLFFWKDLAVMAASAGLPDGAVVLPFFVDADATPNPGGLPVGGVTILDLPNSHLQYAVTWYGLAAALAAVCIAAMLRRRRGGEPVEKGSPGERT